MNASRGWFQAAGAAMRGISANISGMRPAASPAASSFHTTAACLKQQLFGVVLSDSMDKSVVVAVTRLWKHPKYQKVIKKRSKIMAHAEYDEYNLGDKVVIEQHRPISKRKAFIVLRHTDEAKEAELQKMRVDIERARKAKYHETKAFWEEKRRVEAEAAEVAEGKSA